MAGYLGTPVYGKRRDAIIASLLNPNLLKHATNFGAMVGKISGSTKKTILVKLVKIMYVV